MASSFRVKVNPAGVRALLRSEEVGKDLRRRADAIAAAAGGAPDFVVEERVGRNRVRVSVKTATTEGRVKEATDRVLTRAIDAGRG